MYISKAINEMYPRYTHSHKFFFQIKMAEMFVKEEFDAVDVKEEYVIMEELDPLMIKEGNLFGRGDIAQI